MEKIYQYLTEQKAEIINLLCNLIRIPSINPPGLKYSEMCDMLQIELSKLDMDVRRITVPNEFLEQKNIDIENPRINLFANWDVGAEKTLHFNCHYDVVPANPETWNSNPFEPVVSEDRVFGRGACDMKGTIASLLFALRAMRQLNLKPSVNIQVSMTCDEETGGELGMIYFAENENIRADFAVGEGPSGKYIALGNKGILWAEIEIIGKTAHSALSHTHGKNAFEKMLDVASAYRSLKNNIFSKTTSYKTIEPEHIHPSLLLGGQSRAGEKISMVPAKAVFTLDRRLIPEENIEDVKKEILDIAMEQEKLDPDFEIRVNFIYEVEPFYIDENSPIVYNLKNAIKSVTGEDVELILLAGSSDVRYLVKRGIPAVGYSPLGGNYHADNEWVDIQSLIDTATIYCKLITEFNL